MREFEIIINEEAEIISVHDFFAFSIKYHNLSSTADTIPESERIVVRWSTTGIWLIDDELLIEEDGNWRNISDELSFFLERQNPDSTHYPISLKMLFNAIVDSLKHDYWKTPFGACQEHSIRISEIAQHYSKKAIREEQKSIQKELDRVILEDLKKDFINHAKNRLGHTPEKRMNRGLEAVEQSSKPRDIDDERIKEGRAAMDRLNSLLVPANSVPAPRQAAINKREKEEKATVNIDLSTPLGRSQFARKKWEELLIM